MRSITTILFIFLVAGIPCGAQRWRVEASGGAALTDANSPNARVPHTGPFMSYAPPSVPIGTGTIKGLAGLKIMRRDSAFEYGIGAQLFNLKIDNYGGVDTGNYGSRKTINVHQSAVLAQPAVPVTAFINYCHHRSVAHAYVGFSAGPVFARGQVSKDVTDMLYYENFEVHFQSTVGYLFGLQLGFYRYFGAVDIGAELAFNSMHLPLKQGSSGYPFTYNVLMFPVTAHVGYSF